jgi:hypothetical protein
MSTIIENSGLMKSASKYILLFALVYLAANNTMLFGNAQDLPDSAKTIKKAASPYIHYPKAKMQWGYQLGAGLTLTKLPTEIVEEEINQSPMVNFSCRFDTPSKFWFYTKFKTNYLANYFVFGVNYTFINNNWSVSFGNDLALWFGHVEFSLFSLKARGLITYPNLAIGADFDDYFLSLKAEIQYSVTMTNVDGAYFGEIKENRPGVGLTFTVEQPLWDDNWVILGARLNYTTFYYQAWLSYSTLDEYLLYPELIFNFML